jgi:hypothetical protein
VTKTHLLKTVDRYWDALAEGVKTFEVRKNDRAFQTGDKLMLERWEETAVGLQKDFKQEPLFFKITYLLQGGQFGIEPGYCVLGLKRAQR